MNVFVVNCGSSSIKYQLFDMSNQSVLAKGVMERVGSENASLAHTIDGTKHIRHIKAPNHTEGMAVILKTLVDPEIGVLKSISEIHGVGHRVVHGGEQLTKSSRIDQNLLAIIRQNSQLAPLHNPPNLMGIEAAMTAMPDVPHVAVFDTAFLSTLPPRAFRYAVPEDWYSLQHVRRYGFHGTSHKYVTLKTAEILNKPVDKLNVITAHLGNGCSMTAVQGGRAIDHSMGMTPLEGLVMGTRCGDIDPAVLIYMMKQGASLEEIDNTLNKKSGLLGVSTSSNDMRDLLASADKGDPKAALAVEMFVYRVVKYVGSYFTVLPSVDALVLTGGIGENSLPVRHRICLGLERLGAKIDPARNESLPSGTPGPITTDDSALPVWVVPTNEELMIARDTIAELA
ncbi:MAG: acetate kinase [Planctomycetes bacterium]|jgi:acetate kinase|nr:acetate kinase [Planctomycetota bacterium]